MFLKYNVPAALCIVRTVRRIVDWLCSRLLTSKDSRSLLSRSRASGS